MSSEGRSTLLSDEIATEIIRLRREAKWTREDLASRCKALGREALTFGVIGSIETGRPDASGRRRREITADELVILAAALNVPPLQLIYPLGETEKVDMLPGVTTETFTAYRWAYGDITQIVEFDNETGETQRWFRGPAEVFDAHVRHDAAVRRYLHAVDDTAARDSAIRELVRVREEMSRRGWGLPPVPIDDLGEQLKAADTRHRKSLGLPDDVPARVRGRAAEPPDGTE